MAIAAASFSPSPTMIVEPLLRSTRTASTFSVGLRSDSTSSTPTTAATLRATSSRSPVTITIRRTPSARSLRRARAASGRMGSSSVSAPITLSSARTKTTSRPSRSARRRIALPHCWSGPSPSHDNLPTQTASPSTTPRIPRPGISSTLEGSDRSSPRARAARTTAVARTWGETWSNEAASRKTSRSSAAFVA